MESSGNLSQTSPSLSPSHSPSTTPLDLVVANIVGIGSSSKPPLHSKRDLDLLRQPPLYGITSQSWKITVIGARAIIVVKSMHVILLLVGLAHYGNT